MKRLKKKIYCCLQTIISNEENNEEIPDPRNAKEHYQSFIRKKNTKSVKQLKIITYQPKTFANPNFADIKSVITEHPKLCYPRIQD